MSDNYFELNIRRGFLHGWNYLQMFSSLEDAEEYVERKRSEAEWRKKNPPVYL